MNLPSYQYQLVVMGPNADRYDGSLRAVVEQGLREIGLDPETSLTTLQGDQATAIDVKGCLAGIWFGGEGTFPNESAHLVSARTLLDLGGSRSSKTTLYGIWQDGGPDSPNYTLAGGSSARDSSARGPQRGFVMNYNERTGAFGKPKFFSYANAPAIVTHVEGITAVRGGFHLVVMSSAQDVSMAFIPVKGRHGSFGTPQWYPVNIPASSLCPSGCSVVTGNTVYQNHVMGLYIPNGSTVPHTYLATVSTARRSG